MDSTPALMLPGMFVIAESRWLLMDFKIQWTTCCLMLGRRPDLMIALVGFGYRLERVPARTIGPPSIGGGLDGCCLGGVPPLPLVIGSDSSPARLAAAFFIDAGQIWSEYVDTICFDGSDRPIGPSPELGRTVVP
ncbi:hypothetical protein ACLOJK_034248 [Asimina triloba]